MASGNDPGRKEHGMGQTLAEGGAELLKAALLKVQDRIRVYGDQTEIVHPELYGQQFDVLTALHTRFGEHLDTCMGEYFFRPLEGDPDEAQRFCTLITLRGEVPLDNVPELAFAASITNFYLETGCFALDKAAELLVYKNTRTFYGDTPEEVLGQECVRLMEESYETAAKYCTPLLALAEGSMGLEDYMDRVKIEKLP